jgi:hypothetical protein
MSAIALQFDSFSPLTEIAIHNTRQAVAQSNRVIKAFNNNLTPVIVECAKGFAQHWFQSECYWRQRLTNLAGITYNPITAAISAACAELASEDAIATYRRLQHITRETAMDALVIGLCGVVAVAQGVEVAQKVYRTAKRVYDWVDVRVNPAQTEPIILPSVDLFFAQDKAQEDIAATIDEVRHERSFLMQLDRLDTDALALVCAKVDDAIAQVKTQQPRDGMTESQAVESPVAGFGQIWNPQPTDMHTEVQRMLEIARAEDGANALDATAAPAIAEDMLVGALDVPGATGTPKRQPRKKAVETAIVQPKQARAKAKI